MTSASTPSRSISLRRRCGSRAALNALLAVSEHAGFGHDVDTLVLAWHQFRAAGSDAVQQAEIGARLGHPLRTVRPVVDIRHAVLEFARRLVGEERRRHPRHIKMAVSRNPVDISSSTPWSFLVSQRTVRGTERTSKRRHPRRRTAPGRVASAEVVRPNVIRQAPRQWQRNEQTSGQPCCLLSVRPRNPASSWSAGPCSSARRWAM